MDVGGNITLSDNEQLPEHLSRVSCRPEGDNEIQKMKCKRRSIRGRRSVAEIPSNDKDISGEKVLLDEVPNCEDRLLAKIKEVNDIVTETLEYEKDLDLQYEKWEKIKSEKEAAVFEAKRLLHMPLIVSSKFASAVYGKYVKTILQGYSAAEIGQIYVKQMTDQLRINSNACNEDETVSLERRVAELKSLSEAQLRFLELMDELEFEKNISEFDKIIGEEKQWFERNNLNCEFQEICSEVESLNTI